MKHTAQNHAVVRRKLDALNSIRHTLPPGTAEYIRQRVQQWEDEYPFTPDHIGTIYTLWRLYIEE